MKLTHHVQSTRTFIMLLVVVLGAVYAAVLLSGAMVRSDIANTVEGKVSHEHRFDTSKWLSYEDPKYPINLKFPETWTYSVDTKSLAGFYTINFYPEGSKNPLRVYISNKSFVAVDDLKGDQQTIANNLTTTNYDDTIYTIKAGDYFYTFDTTLNLSVKGELSEMVRLARFN